MTLLWRLLCTPPMGGPDNMALDVALMRRARRTGEAVVRVYSWSHPTLSFGRNQRAVDAYDEERLARSDLDVVRRPTGGRALLHHREITYSVTAPADESLPRTYARINDLLINALGMMGVPTAPASRTTRAAEPTAMPCFAEPARGELTVAGRKLVGSAQWRDEGALLQHGSVLVDDDQQRIADLMPLAPGTVPVPATLRALLGRVPAPIELAQHLRSAVRAFEDRTADWFDLEPEVSDDALRLAAGYRDPRWTWRR